MQTWHFVGTCTCIATVIVAVTAAVLWGTTFQLAAGVIGTAAAVAAAATAAAAAAAAAAVFHRATQRCHIRFLSLLSFLFFLFRPYDTNGI